MIRQPDAIVSEEELEALCVHEMGFDGQDRRFAMALPHTMRRSFIGGEMDLLAGLRLQTFCQDRANKASCGSVVQDVRRFLRHEAEFDCDRMTLSCANTLPVI